MEWADDLRKFRESIETITQQRSVPEEVGEEELEERHRLIQEAFDELKPQSYLAEMNRVLLDGRGELELYLPWDEEEDDEEFKLEWEGVDDDEPDDDEPDDDEPDDDEDDEDFDDEDELEGQDVASAILVWDDGQCELAIDIGLEDNRIYWQVNGEDVPTNDGALREALKKAFADEIGI